MKAKRRPRRWLWFAGILAASSLHACSCGSAPVDECFTHPEGCEEAKPLAFEGQSCVMAGSKCTYSEPHSCPSSGGGFGCGGGSSTSGMQRRDCACVAEGVGVTTWRCKITSVDQCKAEDGSFPDVREDSTVDSSSKDAGPSDTDIVIGSLVGAPHGVAVVKDDIFVIDDDTLVRFSLPPVGDGGFSGATIAMDLGSVFGLVGNGDWLYWSAVLPEASAGSIFRLRVQPQVGVPELVAPTSVPPIEGIAIDSTGPRWLDDGIGLMSSDGDGGSALVAAAMTHPTGAFSAIARANGATHFIALDQLVSLDDDGGSSLVIVGGGLAVAAEPASRYVARSVDGGVQIGSILDGGFSPFGVSASLRAMVASNGTVYVADPVTAIIRKIPTSGSASVLASPNGPPNDVAVDGTHVFYTVAPTQSTKGTVHRVPR